MGTTAAQKKLFFNLRRMKSKLDAFEDGDLKPEDVAKIATDLGVSEDEVISMNRRMAMGGDTSLNVADARGWRGPVAGLAGRRRARCRTTVVAEAQEADVRHAMLVEAMDDLNDREKHILTERRLTDDPKTLEELTPGLWRQPRARPPDRGARVRKAAEGDDAAGGREAAARSRVAMLQALPGRQAGGPAAEPVRRARASLAPAPLRAARSVPGFRSSEGACKQPLMIRVFRWAIKAALLFVGVSVLWVLVYRFVPPPFTVNDGGRPARRPRRHQGLDAAVADRPRHGARRDRGRGRRASARITGFDWRGDRRRGDAATRAAGASAAARRSASRPPRTSSCGRAAAMSARCSRPGSPC